MTRTERRMRPRYEQARPVTFGWRDLWEIAWMVPVAALVCFGMPLAVLVLLEAAR